MILKKVMCKIGKSILHITFFVKIYFSILSSFLSFNAFSKLSSFSNIVFNFSLRMTKTITIKIYIEIIKPESPSLNSCAMKRNNMKFKYTYKHVFNIYL